MCREVETKMAKDGEHFKYEGIDEVVFEFDDGSVFKRKINQKKPNADGKGWREEW